MSSPLDHLRAWLALPPLDGDDDVARAARLLRATLRMAIGVVALSVPVVALGLVPASPLAPVLGGALLVLLAGLLGVARGGRVRLASGLLVLVLWGQVTLWLVLFDSLRTPILPAFLLVVLAAAMLLGLRAAIAAAALAFASSLFVVLAERAGLLAPAPPAAALRVWAVFAVQLLVLVGLARVALGDLERVNRALRTEVRERRAVEERLRESESRFRSIVESSPVGIHLCRLEPDGRLVLVGANPAAGRLLGGGAVEAIGQPIEEAFPPLASTDLKERYRSICAGGFPWTSDDVVVENGRLRGVYQVHAFPTGQGSMAAMFLDVTARRDSEESRARLADQLRESRKMEAVGRLAGGIAHDFNNLLMVVMGHGELLRRGLDSADPRLKKVEHIMGAAERAARLVQQLLAFSRRQVLEPQVVDLNSLVADTARLLRPLLGEDVRVVTRLEPALGRVRVDPAQVEQVIMNLAVNARDAMPVGGTLTLETRNVAAARPAAGSWVALAVRDTGHGMDEGTRARAFEPFFTTKAGSGGTGLGLAMVYGVVQQSGGRVTVESEPGRGASFRILLPQAPRGHPAQEPAPPPAASATGGETVLVVEDEPALRTLACEMLAAQGYGALGAGSAEEALELALRHAGPIHLLLTDVVMPGLGGARLAEHFAALRPAARVLFMSGYAGTDPRARGVADDATCFIAKPFTADLLGRRVREALDRPA